MISKYRDGGPPPSQDEGEEEEGEEEEGEGEEGEEEEGEEEGEEHGDEVPVPILLEVVETECFISSSSAAAAASPSSRSFLRSPDENRTPGISLSLPSAPRW